MYTSNKYRNGTSVAQFIAYKYTQPLLSPTFRKLNQWDGWFQEYILVIRSVTFRKVLEPGKMPTMSRTLVREDILLLIFYSDTR